MKYANDAESVPVIHCEVYRNDSSNQRSCNTDGWRADRVIFSTHITYHGCRYLRVQLAWCGQSHFSTALQVTTST